MSCGLDSVEETPSPEGRLRRPFARWLTRQVIPKPVRHRLGTWLGEWQARRSPARVYQNRVILPQIGVRGGTVLLVGCRRYTAQEPAFLARHGVVCWTLDIDPAVVRWGAAGRHVTGRIEQATSHFRAATFDTVLLSGVFGFGVDEAATQDAAIDACSIILKSGGLLVLGWNNDLVSDPASLSSVTREFSPSSDAELGGRVTFRQSTHIFDFYTRRARVGAPTCRWATREPASAPVSSSPAG
jgi:SAM-dependent methyltransferase